MDLNALVAWLKDIGTAGATIFVMLVFIKYIKSRDETMEKALDKMTDAFNTLSDILKGRH